MAEEFVTSAVSIAIEPLLKRIMRPVGYVYNFNKTARELKQKAQELKSRQDLVQHQVDNAKSKAEEIEEIVITWQRDAEQRAVEVQSLEEDMDGKKSFFNGLFPNWSWRYNFAKQATIHIAAMARLYETGNFNRVSFRPRNEFPVIEYFGTKDFLLYTSASVAFHQILKLLEGGKKVIALHGMGGVGKTTLAVEVGIKAKELDLVDEVVMATVTQNPEIEKIQDQIAEMLGPCLEEKSTVGKAKSLSLRLKKSGKNILVILDDLWKKLDLAEIGIPFDDDCNGCTILVTTREKEVGKSMSSDQYNIALGILTEDEAWDLFKRKGNVSHNPSSEFIKVAKSVATECKGLPLAIAVVASALKSKPVEDWEAALAQLKGSRYVNTSNASCDKDVYKCLRLSYDYLRDEDYKLCFLICSLFPEDYLIKVEVLVRFLFGLGLCGNVSQPVDVIRKQVHATIRGLQDSHLLISSSDTYNEEKHVCVKMHDIVRDVALWIASEGERNHIFMGTSGMGLKEWPILKKTNYNDLTAVSLMKNEILQHPNRLMCSRLKLLLLDENGCFAFPDKFFSRMKSLQVLSLCLYPPQTRLSFSLPLSFKRLEDLHTLRMEGLSLKDISIVGKLRKLEILSLCDTDIEELPTTIGDLNVLKMLDLTDCKSLRRIPANSLCKLTALEELYMGGGTFSTHWNKVEGKDSGSRNASLCELTSLSKLSILCLDIDNIEDLPENFYFPKQLVKYDIRIGGSLTRSSYPSSKSLRLKKLEKEKLVNAFKELTAKVNSIECSELQDIENIMGTISDQNESNELKELQTLQVEQCHKLQNIFPAALVARLQNLSKVTILNCKEVNELFQLDVLEQKVLCDLTELRIWQLPSLTRIWKGPTEFVSLEKIRKLDVFKCPKLASLLSVSIARSMCQLQILVIRECEELKQIVFAGLVEEKANVECFPKLRKLELENLPCLIGFCQGNYISLSSCPSLEELGIAGCPNIGTHFIADLEARMQAHAHAQAVGVGAKEGKTEVWEWSQGKNRRGGEGMQEKVLTASLSKVVQEMVVATISKGVDQQQLQDGVEGCKSSNAGWKSLTLDNLPGLTCIWRGGGPSQDLIFHNLLKLCVTRCDGLKNHLFTTSIARSLSQLANLYVEDCKELKQIFADDDDHDKRVVHGERTIEIELPKLRHLQLRKLPNLTSLCPPTYHFLFTSQSFDVIVSGCPNNTTCFFVQHHGGRTKTTVHAKEKAFCMVKIKGKCDNINRTDDLLMKAEEEIDAEIAEVNIS